MIADPDSNSKPIKLAISYRVIWHWRLPIFQRLAACAEYDMMVFHGADFPGTKVVNAPVIENVPHRQMWTIRWISNLLRLPQWPVCPWLIPNLLRFRPDVILAEGNSNLFNNLQLYLFAIVTRTPVVYWTLGALRDKPVTRLDQRIFRAISSWMESRSAAVLGYSSVALEYFQQQGYPEEKQFRAVNVVDTDRVMEKMEAASGEVAALRQRLGLTDKKVVLFVGAIIAAKRLEDLIDAFEVVVDSESDARLVIVGDGPYAPVIREAVAKSSATEKIVLTGKVVDGVSAYFLASDVLVLPHLGGLAISEAMVHGLPIIATVADGCELDLVAQGQNGYIVEVGRPDLLAERTLRLLQDHDLLQKMKQRSREIIETQHNVHTYLAGIRAAIDYAASK